MTFHERHLAYCPTFIKIHTIAAKLTWYELWKLIWQNWHEFWRLSVWTTKLNHGMSSDWTPNSKAVVMTTLFLSILAALFLQVLGLRKTESLRWGIIHQIFTNGLLIEAFFCLWVLQQPPNSRESRKEWSVGNYRSLKEKCRPQHYEKNPTPFISNLFWNARINGYPDGASLCFFIRFAFLTWTKNWYFL